MDPINWQQVHDEIDGTEGLDKMPVVVVIDGRHYEADDCAWNSYDDHDSIPLIYVTTA